MGLWRLKKNCPCSILENLLVQCSCLESLVNFMQILTIFFFLLSWGSCQKCAINWASKDGTWLMKLIIIIIITLYGLGVTSRISSWLKKRRRKKKDRRLCVLMVVVLGDDIPFRQQQWSLSSRRDYQRSDLSCSFQCVYMVWAARRHSVWRSLIIILILYNICFDFTKFTHWTADFYQNSPPFL